MFLLRYFLSWSQIFEEKFARFCAIADKIYRCLDRIIFIVDLISSIVLLIIVFAWQAIAVFIQTFYHLAHSFYNRN